MLLAALYIEDAGNEVITKQTGANETTSAHSAFDACGLRIRLGRTGCGVAHVPMHLPLGTPYRRGTLSDLSAPARFRRLFGSLPRRGSRPLPPLPYFAAGTLYADAGRRPLAEQAEHRACMGGLHGRQLCLRNTYNLKHLSLWATADAVTPRSRPRTQGPARTSDEGMIPQAAPTTGPQINRVINSE